MRFLLRLYPHSWRERYGDEFEALLDEHSVGPHATLDVLRGALDARLRGRTSPGAASAQKEMRMIFQRDELREEIQAILAAREEVGPEHEQHLVEVLLDRLEEVHGSAARVQRGDAHGLSMVSRCTRWLSALLFLWVLAGISSVAVGFPWSLGSTAPAQVFAASVVSGYALVLIVLVFACCLALAAWLTRRLTAEPPPGGYRFQ